MPIDRREVNKRLLQNASLGYHIKATIVSEQSQVVNTGYKKHTHTDFFICLFVLKLRNVVGKKAVSACLPAAAPRLAQPLFLS